MPSNSADRSSSDLAAVPSEDGSGDLPVTAAGASPATAGDAQGVTRKAGRVSGRYIYGFDCAGNPILTEAGY